MTLLEELTNDAVDKIMAIRIDRLQVEKKNATAKERFKRNINDTIKILRSMKQVIND